MYIQYMSEELRCFTAKYYMHTCTYIHCACVQTTLLKIMAVLAKVHVGTLCKQLPSGLVGPCLYYCCTAHQALAALRSLCTEGCARTVSYIHV